MAKKERRPAWDASGVRSLRKHLEMTQDELAEELNVRQQTVSEWETGQYSPRGASERLLSFVAERAEFHYGQPAGEGQGSGVEGEEAPK